MSIRDVSPGDVLVVYDSTFPAWMIRFGAWLSGKPHRWNHMLVISHQDDAGVWWAIEAHPGHVGWTSGQDLQRYLTSPKTLDNIFQSKTDSQREDIVRVARGLFGTPYDWAGIVLDAMIEIKAQPQWFSAAKLHKDPPAHLVCSSLVSYVYMVVGLEYPTGPIRTTTPADWAEFIVQHHYSSH